MFSKKATKIYLTLTTECQIDGVDFGNLGILENMNFTTYDKSTVEISQNFVAFSKYMNFTLLENCVLQIFICEKLAKFRPFAFIKVPLYLTFFLTFIERTTYFENVYL